jgi:hypothetical protein|tara:strand:- start:5092 stop:5256 length:165 start_codon:yes stop_codon:yes gene_type:complete
MIKYDLHGSPKKVLSLPEPKYLLVKEEEENKLGVFMNGSIWYVDRRKVYNVESD